MIKFTNLRQDSPNLMWLKSATIRCLPPTSASLKKETVSVFRLQPVVQNLLLQFNLHPGVYLYRYNPNDLIHF